MDWFMTHPEQVQAFGALLGGLGGFIAVILGLSAYERQQQREAVSRLRVDATRLKQLLSRIDGQLTERSFSIVSNYIASELFVYPEDKSKQGVMKFLQDKKSQSSIVTSVYNGIEKSRVTDTIRDLSEECLQICQRHQSNFPILGYLLGRSCLYAKRSADAVVRPTVYIEFLKSETAQKMLADEDMFPDYINDRIGAAQLTAILATLNSFLLNEGEQQDFDDCEAIVSEIEAFVTTESESKLRGIIRSRRSESRYIDHKLPSSRTVTGQMMLCAKRLRSHLGERRAQKVMQLISQIEARAPDLDQPSEAETTAAASGRPQSRPSAAA